MGGGDGGKRKKRVDGARGRRWRRRRERMRRTREMMAVMAVEVSGGGETGGGGVFTKSQAESAAPFVDATDGGVREKTKRRRMGVASEQWRGG